MDAHAHADGGHALELRRRVGHGGLHLHLALRQQRPQPPTVRVGVGVGVRGGCAAGRGQARAALSHPRCAVRTALAHVRAYSACRPRGKLPCALVCTARRSLVSTRRPCVQYGAPGQRVSLGRRLAALAGTRPTVTPRAQKRSGCGSSAPSARRLPEDAPAALRRPLPTCSSSASPGSSGPSSSCCCTTENASISSCPRRRGHSVALEDTGGGAASGASDADASNQRLAATLRSPSQRASSSTSAASVGPSPTNERSSSTSADCMQTGRSCARDTQTSPTATAHRCQERAKLERGENERKKWLFFGKG